MKTKISRCFLYLFAPLFIASLVGCNPDGNTPTSETENPQVKMAVAEPVHFNSNGLYTTSLYDLDAANLTIKDLDLRCAYLDEKEQEVLRPIAVTNIVNIDKNNLEISFKDESPYLNDYSTYNLYIPKIKTAANIEVIGRKAIIEAEEKFISAHDETQTITLKLNDSKFLNVTNNDIKLAGSLKDFEVKNVSATSDKLTISIKGNVQRVNGINIYNDGQVIVSPKVIKDVNKESVVSIPIEEEMLHFDQSQLKYSNGDVTIPLIVSGEIDPLTLTKEDIVFTKDVTVKAIVNEYDRVYLVLNVAGATDANSAAKIINNQIVKVKNTSLIANTNEASVKINQEDLYLDNKIIYFDLTLHAKAGKFIDDINKDNFKFDGGIKGAKIKDLTLENDTTIKLSLTLPYEKDIKTFNTDGNIIITNGLINLWGDIATSITSTRNYKEEPPTNEWMDDAPTLATGLFTGNELGYTSLGASITGQAAYLGVKMLLEITGVSKSSEYLEHIDNLIKDATNTLSDILNRQNEMLTNLTLTTNLFGLSGFNQNLNELTYWNSKMDEYWAIAMKDIGDTPDLKQDKTVWSKYDKDVQDKINSYIADNDPKFKQYEFTANKIEELFAKICAALKPSTMDNPLLTFDRICSYTYNFDTLAKDSKELFRALIMQSIARALVHILNHDYYDGSTTMCRTVRNEYEEAVKHVKKYSYQYTYTTDASYIYCFTNNTLFWNPESEKGFTTDKYKHYHAYIPTGTFEKDKYLYTFDEAFVNKFISRMVWSTIRKELKWAKFANVGLTDGVAFLCSVKTTRWLNWEDGWFREVGLQDIYLRYMPWDSNKLSNDNVFVYKGLSEEKINSLYRFAIKTN